MKNLPSVAVTRAAAVAVHDKTARLFAAEYETLRHDEFATAFGYGRSKLDALLADQTRELPPGSAVLDVGCGTGEHIRSYGAMGLRPIGIDPATNMRELASKANPGVPILDGSILALPIPDGSIDFVSAIEVLRYLERRDWPKAFSELLRVLRPGGSMFVTFVNQFALDGFYLYYQARKSLRAVLGADFGTHHEFVTPSEVERLMLDVGVDSYAMFGRMFAPIRILYKLQPRLGSWMARRLNRFEDLLASRPWHLPLAGHLVLVARRSR